MRAYACLMMVAVLGLMVTGCGKAEGTDDVAKLMAAMGSNTQTLAVREARNQIQLLKTRVAEERDNVILSRMGIGRDNASFMSSCPASDSVCTITCSDDPSDGSGTFAAACTFATPQTYSCGGTNYTVSSGTFGLTLTLASNTNLTVAMNVSAAVSGGELSGNVACSFSQSFDLNSTVEPEAISCDNYSCNYNGNSIDCEDLREEYAAGCA